jgi:hypothetical protein
MVKLLIPLLSLAASLFAASTARPQIMDRSGPPESYDYPWRVHFTYVEGSSLKYGHMNSSWKTKEDCEEHRDYVLAAIHFKVFPFDVVGLSCRVDGRQT